MVVERTRSFSIVVIMTTYESDEKWYGELSTGIENFLEQDQALDECMLQKRCRGLRDESWELRNNGDMGGNRPINEVL
jgi:hypothetical protein